MEPGTLGQVSHRKEQGWQQHALWGPVWLWRPCLNPEDGI